MLRAVVFDFDGIIADTEPLHLTAYQEVLQNIAITLTCDDYYARYLGFDDAGAFEAIARDCGRTLGSADVHDLILRKARQYEALLARRDVLFPEAAACIHRLATQVPLAIASGARREEIDTVLGRAGLADHFRAIVAAGDTPRGKPAPDPYLRAADLVRGTRAAQPTDNAGFVAIEDSPWGLASARAAGFRSVGVAHTYPPEELAAADLVVSNLGSLSIDALRALAQT